MEQTSTKGLQEEIQVDGGGDLLWIVLRKFHHINQCYMHKPESVLENEMQKILWDFKMQTDHPVQARRPNLVLINQKKRTGYPVDFVMPADHRKNEGTWQAGQTPGPC